MAFSKVEQKEKLDELGNRLAGKDILATSLNTITIDPDLAPFPIVDELV